MKYLYRGTALAGLLGLAGCTFASAEPGLEVVNSCSMANECGTGTECMDGMCITQKADVPLTIALEVTPLRMRDGTEPLPIAVTPFVVDGPTERTVELIEPVVVRGFVRSGANPLQADLSFTPIGTIRGMTAKTITVSTAPTAQTPGQADFEARLLRGREYRMAVRPRDTSLPPRYATITASDQEQVIEYTATMDGPVREVVVSDVSLGQRTLRVRALSVDTAEPISSTAMVVNGRATLNFADEPDVFMLEIRAESNYSINKSTTMESVVDPGPCDSDTPAYPVLTARSTDLIDPDDADGPLRVELPKLAAYTTFRGSVKLCPAGQSSQVTVESVPLSLHAGDLLPNDDVLTASYDASTTAQLDREMQSGELKFCVQVIPGLQYEVLATPSSSLPCALLADTRSITVPASGAAQSPVTLELPEAAYLSGTLRTMDNTPLRGAAIDAIAIASSSMPHNRSRPSATDMDGSFKLQVDLGNYDVIVKPAPGSGLPWQVRHNVEIGAPQDFTTAIDMHLPLSVQGALRYRNGSTGDVSLKDAVVTAYAIVRDQGAERAVPIGSATADDAGKFTLLLPPSIQSGWLSPTRR